MEGKYKRLSSSLTESGSSGRLLEAVMLGLRCEGRDENQGSRRESTGHSRNQEETCVPRAESQRKCGQGYVWRGLLRSGGFSGPEEGFVFYPNIHGELRMGFKPRATTIEHCKPG